MTMSPILILHIIAGAVGLLSGTAALFFRKGSRQHRVSGNVFFASMLIMAAMGAYLSFLIPQMLPLFGGIFTFYLVATAWVTVKRKAGETGWFELGALVVVLTVIAGFLFFGVRALNGETDIVDGMPIPAGTYFAFGAIAGLSAVGDIRMIIRGGIKGAGRIARHLWRMCFALYFATSSLFLGQPQVFPETIRKIEILSIPVILVIVLMFFWLFRVLFTNSYKKA